MKISACILSTAVVCVILTNKLPSEGWRGIVPLRSTRADVERELGEPIDDLKSLYDTGKERVSVFYQQVRCPTGGQEGPQRGWDVPVGTVLRISVSPKG
jgi:hypothetical protein